MYMLLLVVLSVGDALLIHRGLLEQDLELKALRMLLEELAK